MSRPRRTPHGLTPPRIALAAAAFSAASGVLTFGARASGLLSRLFGVREVPPDDGWILDWRTFLEWTSAFEFHVVVFLTLSLLLAGGSSLLLRRTYLRQPDRPRRFVLLGKPLLFGLFTAQALLAPLAGAAFGRWIASRVHPARTDPARSPSPREQHQA